MPNDIAGLRELEMKATAGPWEVFTVDKDVSYTSISSNGLTILCVETESGWPEVARSYAGFSEVDDAIFIAALRNACPELLALAEIGRAAVEVRRNESSLGETEWESINQKRLAATHLFYGLRNAYLSRKDGWR